MFVNLVNNYTGGFITAKVGFSWTTFFWGSLAPLFRGDFFWFFILLLIDFASFGIITRVVFCWIYNGIYLRKQIRNGYRPADMRSAQILRSNGYII